MPTGGRKSLLFTAPACLDRIGTTIVVVPFRALINDLVEKAKKTGINSVEWRPGEVNPATIVTLGVTTVTAGLAHGWIATITGRLGAAIVSHATLNGSAVLLLALLPLLTP